MKVRSHKAKCTIINSVMIVDAVKAKSGMVMNPAHSIYFVVHEKPIKQSSIYNQY